jgi:hypothetical protein
MHITIEQAGVDHGRENLRSVLGSLLDDIDLAPPSLRDCMTFDSDQSVKCLG